MNLIEKYLAKAAGKECVVPGQDISAKVSFCWKNIKIPVAEFSMQVFILFRQTFL